MSTRSSVLAWRILGTGEPGGLPSMGSHRVGHDWSDLAAAAAAAVSPALADGLFPTAPPASHIPMERKEILSSIFLRVGK